MERLTIDEIIGHCERKTEQYERLFGKERLETTSLISSVIKEYWEHKQVAGYLKKLKDYEDLEERLNKIYGDCDGLLESMVELLEKHSGVDIPDDTVKVLLITNESVDFYKKCKSLEEQGRLIKLPCKVGDTVYHVVQGRIIEVSNVDLFFLLLSVVENRFNNSVFLTKSEAEAKLEELRCNNDRL